MTNADEAPVRASKVWSGREDLNLRHPAPKAGALPGCDTPRSESILQQVANLCKGFRSMADAILLFARKFGQGLAQFGHVKHGIVAKPSSPGRLLCDQSIKPTGRHLYCLGRQCH